jgi:hypothetical protein
MEYQGVGTLSGGYGFAMTVDIVPTKRNVPEVGHEVAFPSR